MDRQTSQSLLTALLDPFFGFFVVIILLTDHMSYAMYIVSVFIGIANALMMV
jgi:hypothetical protein